MYNNRNLIAEAGNWRNIRNVIGVQKVFKYRPFCNDNIYALIRYSFMLPDCYDYAFSTKEA